MRKMALIVCACAFLAVSSAHADFSPIPPDQLDFYQHYSVVYTEAYLNTCANPSSHCICDFGPCPEEASSYYVQILEPNTADINGGFDLDGKRFYPNGMLDCNYEMAMIATVLKKPAGFVLSGPYGQGVSRDQLTADWEFNLARLRSDLQGAATLLEMAGGALVPHLYAIITAQVLIGDEDSCSYAAEVFRVAKDLGVGTFDPANYLRYPGLFGPAGDADRDGYSNYAEYVAFGPSSAKGSAEFLGASLNPAITPAGEPDMADSDHDGLLDSQEDLNGNGVVDEGESDPQTVDTDADGVSDGMERLVWGTDPSTADDKPEVPGLGLLGLAALGGLIGACGAKRMRK